MRELEALLFLGFLAFFILTVIWYVRKGEREQAERIRASIQADNEKQSSKGPTA